MKQKYGSPPLDYLTRYQIEQETLLLVNSDLPIARVAEEVGIQNVSYFCAIIYLMRINERSISKPIRSSCPLYTDLIV